MRAKLTPNSKRPQQKPKQRRLPTVFSLLISATRAFFNAHQPKIGGDRDAGAAGWLKWKGEWKGRGLRGGWRVGGSLGWGEVS